MSNDRFKFRVFDNALGFYREECFNEMFLLSPDGGLVFWHVRDGKLRPEDNSRFVVEACTGFKDANGRLIYAGDIIEKRDNNFCLTEKYLRRAVYHVPFYAKFFAMKPGAGTRFPLDEDSAKEYRVIGNINENRELLDLKAHYDRHGK